ncbi:MAG: tRNA (adenosine(37)-N6)-threonylcarbamoyltransferase complex transferase subunit TsaD [Candidatus Levybacteria bacterium]|nr:tRNA (adenosine(37)-N6)-threonylcarbamoyltransferase complex transferase subunit TsaD [Candidatus Levybacteria bacterium]
MLILGIETSCDETGVAIVEGNKKSKKVKLLSNALASSLPLHSKSGGIIPESAAREQIKFIIPTLKQALSDADVSMKHIDAFAVTFGPGLIGSLLIGVETVKTLSYIYKKPLIPTNHLLGHIYANFIEQQAESRGVVREEGIPTARRRVTIVDEHWREGERATGPRANIDFPAIGLIVSGGHTDLILMEKHGRLKWLGGTRDDAAGECFDKCARLLGYNYPGGPRIAELAKSGDPTAFSFPRPMLRSHDFEFSFSGLKTAFLNETKQRFPILRTGDKKIGWDQIALKEQLKNPHIRTLYDLCASLQQAIIDVLIKKTMKAAEKYSARSILLGGGVAANQKLRDELQSSIINHKSSIRFFAPAKNLCTDNGAMIAAAAFYNYQPTGWQKVDANPSLYF